MRNEESVPRSGPGCGKAFQSKITETCENVWEEDADLQHSTC